MFVLTGLLQLLRFGVVGAIASITHVGVFVVLIEAFEMPPLSSNFFAFCVAFTCSYLGHFHWTFRKTGRQQAPGWNTPLPKFLVVALTGLLLNTLAVWTVVDALGQPYGYAVVLMLTVVPASLFLLSKLWAFA